MKVTTAATTTKTAVHVAWPEMALSAIEIERSPEPTTIIMTARRGRRFG